LQDFVDAQLNYYNSCSKTLLDLSRQIGSMGLVNANAGKTNLQTQAKALNEFSGLNGGGLPTSFTSKKTAKVLFDYEATDPSEISVSANQIISVQIVPNDNDWVLAESGRDSGKVPKAYIQIVD
jgi:hypothetical protein